MNLIPKKWKVYKANAGPGYDLTGYGAKLPTKYMVSNGKRLYPVFAICYQAEAAFYIVEKQERIFVPREFLVLAKQLRGREK